MAKQSGFFWWAAGSAALMGIGAIGPWARVLFVSVSGLDGDGWIVLVAAIAAGIFLFVYVRRQVRLAPIGAALMGLIGIAVVIYDGKDIYGTQGDESADSLFGDADLVSPGWGITLAGVASVSLIVASAVLYYKEQVGSKPSVVDAPTEPGSPSNS